MPLNTYPALDETDSRILNALQEDGRISTAELARRINLSASSTAERLRRLTEGGVIRGFRAVVDPEAVGLPILAIVRLRYPSGYYKPFYDLMENLPQVTEAHHVTGEDCFILKVHAASMAELERTNAKLATLGAVSTSVVYSTPVEHRAIVPPVST
ncbi:Lrp/AsnC family transcriptional regulator [Nesterenkonia ebinurensis]|uniref:Lrp/AsnC family transcriptional regulator n=1 Tax=Nesterenkonia ebinurensis TaxID=2608252 RepID=UPI00123D8FE2|nr:Lrp/AsnC family transcriptional regulator [Nesterenkonia ebinurensis]